METSDEFYSQILANDPSPKTLFLILSKFKEEGELKRVIQESLKALNVYPNDIHIRKLLAETYLQTGIMSEAETELGKVTSLIDDLVSAYKLQAQIYHKQGRVDEALSALRLYLAHQPNDPEATGLLENLRPSEAPPCAEIKPSPEELLGPVKESVEKEPSTTGEEEAPDIATPTLSERDFNGGRTREALNTYEMRERRKKVIATLELWQRNLRKKFNPPLIVT